VSVKKRHRKVIESDDEEEDVAVEEKTETVEIQLSIQEYKDEELTATTKRLKLDPTSPKKPKAQPLAAKEPVGTKTAAPVKEDVDVKDVKDKEEVVKKPAEDEDDIDDKFEADEIEQEKESAAKW
jgi:DNA ligase-1